MLFTCQVWVYAVILTEAGAYDNASTARQQHCRTDQSSVLQNSPWGRFALHAAAPERHLILQIR